LIGEVPCEHRRNVMPRAGQARVSARAESSVGFNRQREVFPAETTGAAACQSAEGAGDANAVPELQSFVFREVLFDRHCSRHVPTAQNARQNQLAFQFVRNVLTQFGDLLERQSTAAHYFLLDSTRFVDPLVFDVEDRVHAMLALQRSESVLPSPPRKAGPVASRSDPFRVKFGGPPSSDAVLEFEPRRRVRGTASFWKAAGACDGDFEVVWFFEEMIVGHEVGALLRRRGSFSGEKRETADEQRKD